jgi:CheY-like chemotaxis protein
MPKYKRCILIDDSKADLFIAKLIIQKCNLESEVITLNNGEEALEWFQAHQDIKDTLVLLDINMPVMNGFEFLESIKPITFDSSVDVYLLSSSTHPEDQKRAQEYDLVKSYLVKPIKRETILELIN